MFEPERIPLPIEILEMRLTVTSDTLIRAIQDFNKALQARAKQKEKQPLCPSCLARSTHGKQLVVRYAGTAGDFKVEAWSEEERARWETTI